MDRVEARTTIPEAARDGDPRVVRGRSSPPAVPRQRRPIRGPRVRGDGPADAGRPGRGSVDPVHRRLPERRRPRGGHARRTCSAPGRASATTGVRSTCGGRPRRSSTSTADASRRTSMRSRRCRASGRTPPAPSRRSPSGCRSARSTPTCGGSSGGSSPAMRQPSAPATLQAVADAAVPAGRSADWTHAVMDLGATVCTPRRPDCAAAPFEPGAAMRHGPPRPPRRRRGRRSCRADRRSVAAACRATPFPETTRWLRGRIVDRLRAARGDGWAVIDAPIGTHDHEAVAGCARGPRARRARRARSDPGEPRALPGEAAPVA